MDTIRELMALGRDNWPLLKDVLSMVGGAATVLGLLATLTGFKKRLAEKSQAKRQKKQLLREARLGVERERSEWFAYLYRHKMSDWYTHRVDKMTVQQACGYLGDDLPEWARDGWERVLVEDLNQPVKKKT